MANKNYLVIQPNGVIISHMTLQSDVIILDEEKRQKLIQILRQIPAFLDAAKKLSEGKTYRAFFPPEVLERIKDGSARLDKKDNGFFGALIRDVETGQVTEHVGLREIAPDFLGSLNQLATQQTLADIVRRLEVIDEKITSVLQGQFNDRLAEVESGIHIYEQAVVASDPKTRHDLLIQAVAKLTEGRDKLLNSTDFNFIDKLPRTKLKMLFSRNIDISRHVQLKAELVWKAAHTIIKASRFLVMAYSALNDLDSLRVSLEQVESQVKIFQEKTGEIVRWLPPTSNLHECLTTISQGVLPNIDDFDEIPQKTIIIKFQPQEIIPPKELDYESLQG